MPQSPALLRYGRAGRGFAVPRMGGSLLAGARHVPLDAPRPASYNSWAARLQSRVPFIQSGRAHATRVWRACRCQGGGGVAKCTGNRVYRFGLGFFCAPPCCSALPHWSRPPPMPPPRRVRCFWSCSLKPPCPWRRSRLLPAAHSGKAITPCCPCCLPWRRLRCPPPPAMQTDGCCAGGIMSNAIIPCSGLSWPQGKFTLLRRAFPPRRCVAYQNQKSKIGRTVDKT